MKRLIVLLLIATAGANAGSQSNPRPEPPPPAPAVEREFRAAWVATVANIDWPSKPGLTTAEQQAELIAIMDRASQLKLNAIVFQVRPAADALYASKLEPWSESLSGTQGVAPDPYYDPLTFAIDEAHKRGIELHAWINPYRAKYESAKSAQAATHISRTHPELVRRYGRALWMDPGERAVQDWSLKVVRDIVHRYDVDGVHIDDYFYPYPELDSAKQRVPFPDGASYARYRHGGGQLELDDWRRENVNAFIKRLYATVKAEKPWVKVGISPFGIWRPGHPQSIKGFDAYSAIFADSRKWFRAGWLDYLAPQLYWPVAPADQSYPVLLKWWAGENVLGRHLWPGNYTGRIGANGSRPFTPSEVLQQIRLTRMLPSGTGNIHFSMKTLMQNSGGIVDSLTSDLYSEPALVPSSPWLGRKAPATPRIRIARDSAAQTTTVQITPAKSGAPAFRWVVQARRGNHWTTTMLPASQLTLTLADSASAAPEAIEVSAVSRLGDQGPRTKWAAEHAEKLGANRRP